MYTRTLTSADQRRNTRSLERDATLRLNRNVVVAVESGVVLVTREGDPEDHVLEAGMELRLPARGLAVAWALERSTVYVREAAADRPARAVVPASYAPDRA